MKKILKINKVEKYYGNKGNIVKAIDDVSFDVKKSEFVGIMGPSGSGKTTLLNMIATIDDVSSGNIYLDGKDLTEINPKNIAKFRRENLGFIFQDFNLLDTLTIHENIALALTINKTKKSEIDGKVLAVAKELGYQPYVITLAEGHSFVMINGRYLGATILMVTHDSFTASYCNRILFIKDGKIFTELVRGENTRRQFFNKILDVVALLGGDVRDVR